MFQKQSTEQLGNSSGVWVELHAAGAGVWQAAAFLRVPCRCPMCRLSCSGCSFVCMLLYCHWVWHCVPKQIPASKPRELLAVNVSIHVVRVSVYSEPPLKQAQPVQKVREAMGVTGEIVAGIEEELGLSLILFLHLLQLTKAKVEFQPQDVSKTLLTGHWWISRSLSWSRSCHQVTNTMAPDSVLKTDFSFEMSQHGTVYLWWSSFASHSTSCRMSTPAAAACSTGARQPSEPG